MGNLYVGWVLPYLSGEEEGYISSSQIKGKGLSETHSESLACAFWTLETGIPLAKRSLQVRDWLELSISASKEKEGLHFHSGRQRCMSFTKDYVDLRKDLAWVVSKGNHTRGLLSGRTKDPKERLSMRETAGNPMGWGQNWKLPAGGEMASLTKNLGSNQQRHLPKKKATKVHLPNPWEPMMVQGMSSREDCPSLSPILGPCFGRIGEEKL